MPTGSGPDLRTSKTHAGLQTLDGRPGAS